MIFKRTSSANAHKPYRYIALGDSIATGHFNNNLGYPSLLHQLLQQHQPTQLDLLAQNGQTSRQLLKQWPHIKPAVEQANLITFNIGGNDLRLAWRIYGAKQIPNKITKQKMEIALTTLVNNWHELITKLQAHTPNRSRIVTINLFNPYATTHPETIPYIDQANAQLANLCRMHQIDVIDAYSLLNLNNPSDIHYYLAKDGLHLNSDGQQRLARALYNHLHPVPLWKWLAVKIKLPGASYLQPEFTQTQ